MCEDECQDLFQRLKHMITLMTYPDTKKEYKIYTDTSNLAIGACLTLQIYDAVMKRAMEIPVYFLSHKLSDTQMRWSIIEKKSICHLLGLAKYSPLLP